MLDVLKIQRLGAVEVNMADSSKTCQKDQQVWVLQFCHGYDGPFLDCARQYAVLFKNSPYKVCTVYLTGSPDAQVAEASASDEVIFMGFKSSQLRGLKLGAIKEFRKIVRSRAFSFCIAHRFKPTYIALLSSELPVIGIQHAFDGYKRISRKLIANLFNRRLCLLGVSDAVRDNMREHLSSWPEDSIQTLYNRIDIASLQRTQLSKADSRAELDLPNDAWIIGNVGRLHPDKDQQTLIRGFAKACVHLPENARLAILGTGRLEPELRALALNLGVVDRVLFLGQVPQARRYFKAFDVFALTSDREPFGMVLLEAMAAGVVVICSDCGGGREVIQGNGILFDFADADGLAQRLVECAKTTPNEQVAMLESAYKRLEQDFCDDVAHRVFFDNLAVFKRKWS